MTLSRLRVLGLVLGFGLGGTIVARAADDPPAKAKDDKPIDAKSEFAAIEKEYQAATQAFFKKLQEIEDRNEQRKTYTEQFPKLIDGFADRVTALEKTYPDDPATARALMWLLGNTQKPELQKTLLASVKAKLDKASLESLPALLGTPNPQWGPIGVAVLTKVKDLPADANVEKVVAWAAQTTVYGGPDGVAEAYNKSIELLVEKFPASRSFVGLAANLAADDNPKWALEQFRKLLAKNPTGDIRLIAQFGIGSMLAGEDGKEKEAIETLEVFVKEAKDVKSIAEIARAANAKLKDLKLINNPIPEIAGEDLDGKEFKISDYKGKVVLLDFWGFW